jgi:hypothetical protein
LGEYGKIILAYSPYVERVCIDQKSRKAPSSPRTLKEFCEFSENYETVFGVFWNMHKEYDEIN